MAQETEGAECKYGAGQGAPCLSQQQGLSSGHSTVSDGTVSLPSSQAFKAQCIRNRNKVYRSKPKNYI